MRVSSSIPIACGHDLLSSSNQSKRAHRGDFRMASITKISWVSLSQSGRQLLEQFSAGSRKPAMIIKRAALNEIGTVLAGQPNQPLGRLEPEHYETGLTDHASLGIVYLLTAIHAADPNFLMIRNNRVVCRVAETIDDTITIQLLRSIKPITAKQAVSNGQLRFSPTKSGRLLPA